MYLVFAAPGSWQSSKTLSGGVREASSVTHNGHPSAAPYYASKVTLGGWGLDSEGIGHVISGLERSAPPPAGGDGGWRLS